MLNHVVRIDDERSAERSAFLRITHAEHVDQRAGGIGKHPVIQSIEILVVAAPRELDELVIGRATEQDGIAILEVVRELREAGNFGWANEREILRIKVNDFPLAGERALVDRFERADSVFFMMIKAGLDADDAKRIELLTDGFH